MSDDPFLNDIIAELRGNEGEMLRRLLKALCDKEDPEAKDLYVTLIQHPELYDLVPN
jgi:hypothetical protein